MGGCIGGFVRTLCSFAKEKGKKTTHKPTNKTKKQTGHKKAQTATLEGAGEAMDGRRGEKWREVSRCGGWGTTA